MITSIFLILSFLHGLLALDNDRLSVKIIDQKNDQVYIEGEPILLACEVYSNQTQFIDFQNLIFEWTFNGQTIQQYYNNHQLIIPNSSYANNFGEYRCLVKTKTLLVQSEIHLLNIYWISKYVKIIHFKYPETNDEIDDYQIAKKFPNKPINLFKLNDKLALRCDASGYPDVQINWFLNGDLLIAPNGRNTGSKYAIEINNLFINVTNASVQGTYSCNVRNSIGQVSSQNSFVLVVKLPSQNLYAELQSISSETIATNNSNVNIFCQFQNYDQIVWHFFGSNLALTNNSNLIVWPNGTLSILNFNKQNQGTYKCIAHKNKKKIIFSIQVKFSFLEPFSSNSILALYNSFVNETIIVPQNSKFYVYCLNPKGFPSPNIYWLDDKNNVIGDNGQVYAKENHELIFDNTNFNQSGSYKCIAENLAGKQSKQFKIIVTSKAELEAEHQILEVFSKESENVTLNCLKSKNFKFYSIVWYHNGLILSKNIEIKRKNAKKYWINENNFSLNIYSLDTSDNGFYVCQINQTGFKLYHNAGYRLKVNEKLKFLVPLSNKRLELNKSNKIHCKTKADSHVQVKWFLGDALDLGLDKFNLNQSIINDLKKKSSINNTFVTDKNSVLVFKKFRKQDEGFYTCFAYTNEEQIFNSIRVDGVILPRFIVKPEFKVYVEQNETLVLNCEVEGYPKPSINWDKNKNLNLINKNPRITVLNNGSLVISNISLLDEGVYGCTAGNAGGFIRAESSVQPKNFNRDYRYMNDFTDETTINFKINKTVAIAISITLFYIFIILGLLMWYRCKKLTNSHSLGNEILHESLPTNSNHTNTNSLDNCIPMLSSTLEVKDNNQKLNESLIKPVMNNTETGSINSNTLSTLISSNEYKENFKREKLITIMLLGHGEFGEVYLAKVIRQKNIENMVMVKSLQTNDSTLINEFNKEIQVYKQLNHDKIAKLFGICSEKNPKLLIIEYSDLGDLKQYLLATKLETKTSKPNLMNPDPLTNHQILDIALQVASGMNYLTNLGFVHKDLATRNCLISNKLQIKITSCSLSKNTYSKEYISFRNRDLPLRWSPNESIFEDKWTNKSDVWSFSVFFWELCTSAELPYAGKQDEEVFVLLKCNQLRVNFSEFQWLNENILDLLNNCLNDQATKRPDFTHINQTLLNEINLY